MYGTGILFQEPNPTGSRNTATESGTLCTEFDLQNPTPPGASGTDILLKELNPTGSLQRDLIGLCGPTQETHPPAHKEEGGQGNLY